MNRLLTAGAAGVALLAIALAVVLAGCGGGGGGGSAGPAEANDASTVSADTIGDAGRVLVDSAGKALYASDQETGGMVLCTDACLTFWEPLTVANGAPTDSSLPGKLGVVERPDGSRQVTYDGKLLYSFTEDQPGEVTGDGFSDAFGGQQFTWHAVHATSGADSSGGGAGSGGGGFGY